MSDYTREDREMAWEWVIQHHGNARGVIGGATLGAVLRDCVPVPRDYLERLERALRDISRDEDGGWAGCVAIARRVFPAEEQRAAIVENVRAFLRENEVEK